MTIASDKEPYTLCPLSLCCMSDPEGKARTGNRDAQSLLPVLEFVVKYIGDPRYTRLLVGIAHWILDIYSPAVSLPLPDPSYQPPPPFSLSLPPSLPDPLPPFLPPSPPPSLPPSVPPCLPACLPASLPPSLSSPF